MRVASSPNGATSCMPIGRPLSLVCSGRLIAGWPPALSTGRNDSSRDQDENSCLGSSGWSGRYSPSQPRLWQQRATSWCSPIVSKVKPWPAILRSAMLDSSTAASASSMRPVRSLRGTSASAKSWLSVSRVACRQQTEVLRNQADAPKMPLAIRIPPKVPPLFSQHPHGAGILFAKRAGQEFDQCAFPSTARSRDGN